MIMRQGRCRGEEKPGCKGKGEMCEYRKRNENIRKWKDVWGKGKVKKDGLTGRVVSGNCRLVTAI